MLKLSRPLLTIALFIFLGTQVFHGYAFPQAKISAGVVPHHLLAKDLINNFFEYITSQEKPDCIVLLGPDHFKASGTVGKGFITVPPEIKDFQGIEVDHELLRNLKTQNKVISSSASVNSDHAITNLTPFIKNYLPRSKIAPFLISADITLKETENFAASLHSLAPAKTMVIASVDFSHGLPSSAAKFHDIKSIRTLINLEKRNFQRLEVDCWPALYIARTFAGARGAESPRIIGHYQSIDFLKGQSNAENVTSYFSLAFERGSPNTSAGKTILLVGDIMLDRKVEGLMKKNSVFYPFAKIHPFLKGADIVFGNLEGPIVKKPREFPKGVLRFAFSADTIKGLSFANFNLLSLANNHLLDMGKGGLKETRELLGRNGIGWVGDPVSADPQFSFSQGNITFLAFHQTFVFGSSEEEIIKTVKLTRRSNPKNFIIVSIHWGDEYKLKSSPSQKRLAHKIINAGGDLIIGHHPHVVQDIELYRGKIIFYSLGNFIFDQYFSKDTQQGLAAGLEIYPQKHIYRLFPIESELSQPFLMKQKDSKGFLKKLAQRSSAELFEQIRDGTIEVKR